MIFLLDSAQILLSGRAVVTGIGRLTVRYQDKKLYSFTLDTPALRQLGQAAEVYVTVQLERSFRTLDYYKSILPQEETKYE